MKQVETRGPFSSLYQQVARHLATRIAAGEVRPGERLPSERELQQEFGVSRVTLRRALGTLVEQGLVIASPGRGWFVSMQLNEPPGTLVSFSELVALRGLQPSSRVLEIGVRPATVDEADGLDMAPGAPLFFVKRIRFIDGVATGLDYSRLPAKFVPGIEKVDFSSASLYATLRERFQVYPTRADLFVEAVRPNDDEAALLEISADAPLLLTSQTTYDHAERRIETGRLAYRGDRYRFHASLVAAPEIPEGCRDASFLGLGLSAPVTVARSRDAKPARAIVASRSTIRA